MASRVIYKTVGHREERYGAETQKAEHVWRAAGVKNKWESPMVDGQQPVVREMPLGGTLFAASQVQPNNMAFARLGET
ncbi:hypothetical protein GGTG_04024 [Gaeumannomyces tritici R3-111a-1]|uniref:Uncharacterized protein n=1 Tax=Gaeumannomyces tritici (strain R3-111a-1) TaxID=644352 RepID=J3NRX6_GAET3|nr:hypothetical protein GGTG_04024 [Gaeumannomyces tritici R3-111a-1]EJT78932.1 hypothetical protein GGTG_04024 [Gaeumannomyces tritici R3-111a-1]